MINHQFEAMRKYNRKVAHIAAWGILASVIWFSVFQAVLLNFIETGHTTLGIPGAIGLLASALMGFNAVRLILELRHMLFTISAISKPTAL